MGYLRTLSVEWLSKAWVKLTRHRIEYRHPDGRIEVQLREVHDHGDGAAVLPYDPLRNTILVVRQFRLPAYLNGHPAPLIEVCAGLLDGDNPEAAARREAEEELGYRVHSLVPVANIFSTPGAVTERVMLFTACYDPTCRVGPGGGHKGEGEDIEILELDYETAMMMAETGEIVDAKTIILLQHLRLKGIERKP